MLKSEHLHADSKAMNQGGVLLENLLRVRKVDGFCMSSRSSPILEQRGHA